MTCEVNTSSCADALFVFVVILLFYILITKYPPSVRLSCTAWSRRFIRFCKLLQSHGPVLTDFQVIFQQHRPCFPPVPLDFKPQVCKHICSSYYKQIKAHEYIFFKLILAAFI